MLIGFFKSENAVKRSLVLGECVSLVRYINSQIDYTDDTLQKIIFRAAESGEYTHLLFLNELSCGVYEKGFDELWSEGVEKSCGKPCFDSRTVHALKSFGQKLGKSDSAGQKELCANFEQEFLRLYTTAEQNKAEKIKLYRVTGLAAGIIIFIFVI